MSESRVFKLSALLEAKVRDEGGRKLGKVHDVRVRRAGEGYEIEGLVVGKRGLLCHVLVALAGEPL